MQIILKSVLGTELNCVAFEFYLLECDDVQSVRSSPTFWEHRRESQAMKRLVATTFQETVPWMELVHASAESSDEFCVQ